MKNMKKMMLALTMLTLGSVYISASSVDSVTGVEHGSSISSVVHGLTVPATITPFWPANSDNKSGQWFKESKTASVGVGTKNQIDYTDVYEQSGMTGYRNSTKDTDFTPLAGYENIGISVIGSGSSLAGYAMSYLFGKPAQALRVDSEVSVQSREPQGRIC